MKNYTIYNRRDCCWQEVGVEGSQHSQQPSQAGKETTPAPLLTHTDTRDRLQLRYTLINGKFFLNADESLIKKHEAHPVPSEQDVY